MDWFEVTNTEEDKILINANEIMTVTYHEKTNLTEIVFTRSGYPPLFVRGDIKKDIKRLLNSHDNWVSTLTT